MRYYTKTIFGIFALVCLALIAVALNEAAVNTAVNPSKHAAVQIIEPDHTPAKELLYEDLEVEAEPEQTAPIYDISLSAELQEYTYNRCEELGLVAPGVDYPTVLALMSKESGYTAEAVSGTGDYGIMQINTVNHGWLREELGITDFLDAEQSIDAGTEMLARLSEKYGDPHKVLMAYNMGEGGAAKLWAQGITSSEYSRDIMSLRAEILEKGV
mgnify:CR=1 FL=1